MKPVPVADILCRICGAAALVEFIGYSEFRRVTSDCKPWPAGGRLTVCGDCGAVQKIADRKWRDEIGRIYGGYEIYRQGGGAEQPIYDATNPTGIPRSRKLILHLIDVLGLPDRGSLLDFGCGTGVTLRSFAALRPDWKLYGSELSDRDLGSLRDIPGFEQLYTGSADKIARRFTLVTLIHSLEHVTDPVETLAALRDCVESDGHLFVQVPDCSRNPYDLLVADHVLHFTRDSLRFAAERAGLEATLLSNSLVNKELSLVARPSIETGETKRQDHGAMTALVQSSLATLSAQLDMARTLASESPNFGIFGTSISATWLYGCLAGQVKFFVDEDPNRIGRSHMGLPIFAPAEIPARADVFVPLIPEVASSIARRLARSAVRFHIPPAAEAIVAAPAF